MAASDASYSPQPTKQGSSASSCSTCSGDSAAAARKPLEKRWSTVGSKLSPLMRASISVIDENKVGVVPSGEMRTVVDALHNGLGPALLGSKEGRELPRVKMQDTAVFTEFRRVLGIPEAAFYASLALQKGRKSSDMRSIPVTQAAGKSKSFFFLSPDQHYLLKSANADDLGTLRRIASKYIQHFREHPDSLLPRYVAVLELEMQDHHSIRFIVMCNALGGSRPIHRRFDMKGSSYNRVASSRERLKEHPVFKDQDWLAEGRELVFAADDEHSHLKQRTASAHSNRRPASRAISRSTFVEALRCDTDFLRRMSLIDYSILVGVHECVDSADNKVEQTPGLVALVNPDTVCYICLIDILTSYGMKKRFETLFMGILMCRDISCQPPGYYSRRFMRFINEISVVKDRRSFATVTTGGSTFSMMPDGWDDEISIDTRLRSRSRTGRTDCTYDPEVTC